MDKNIETNFVKKFISADAQSRIIYELNSKSKRKDAIQKLFDKINEKNIIFCDAKISEDEILKKISKIYNISSDCYIIGDSSIDGKVMNFKSAFRYVMDNASINIIICGNETVFIKEELSFGSSSKCLLYKKA